jgi:hypothetical protein
MATDVFKVTCIRDPEEGVDVKVERDTREATMVALDQKILRTIATQRYRKQFQQRGPTATKRMSIDALSAAHAKPENSNESNVIAARRQSAEPDKGSKERLSSTESRKSPRQRKSPRVKKGAAAQQSNEQTTERLEKKRMAFEKSLSLEEKAKQAAEAHLQMRANRVEELRSELKEKRNQSTGQAGNRKASKESVKSAEVHGEATNAAYRPSTMNRMQSSMIRTKARSFIRVSLHGRHVKSAEAAVGKIQSGRDLPVEPLLPAVDSKRGSKTRANS